jgi:RsiW-degrading membrane proteinase PrsW (M82 family)
VTPARTPSFWFLVVTVAIGGVAVAAAGAVLVYYTPWSAFAVAQPLAALAVALLMLLRYLDPLGRRPCWTVLLAFLWGATVAVGVGAASGFFLDDLLATATSPGAAAVWGAAAAAPPSEELAKVAGVVLLFLAARPHLSTVTSGAVYGAVVGVGFATTEDASYALLAADETLPDHVPEALRLVALRAAVPGLVGHPLFTALAGAGFAYAVLRVDRARGRRALMLGAGLGLAILTHAAVNSPLAAGAAAVLDGLPGVGALVGYFLVVLVPSVVGLVWLARLVRADARRLTDRLVGLGFATPAEASGLASRRERARMVHATGRTRAARAAGWRVVDALVRLAERPDPRAGADLGRARADLYALSGSASLPARPPASTAARWRWRWAAVAVAVGAYMWLAGLLLVTLYPT